MVDTFYRRHSLRCPSSHQRDIPGRKGVGERHRSKTRDGLKLAVTCAHLNVLHSRTKKGPPSSLQSKNPWDGPEPGQPDRGRKKGLPEKWLLPPKTFVNLNSGYRAVQQVPVPLKARTHISGWKSSILLLTCLLFPQFSRKFDFSPPPHLFIFLKVWFSSVIIIKK